MSDSIPHKRFALVLGSTVSNVTMLDPAFAEALSGYSAVVEVGDDVRVGWMHHQGRFTAPVNTEPPAIPIAYRTALTPSEFRNAFSAFEEVALVDFAAGESEGDSTERKMQRKVVGVFFDRVRDPHLTTVDLADPRNLAGLDLLVAVGILTKARRDTIAKGLPVPS